MRFLLPLSLLPLIAAAPAAITPTNIVASAPASAWRAIRSDDLLVIDLKNGRRIVIQLAPRFAPVHVGNIRALARSGWWDGATVYRVQDNYVVQWGHNEGTVPLPSGVIAKPPAEYWRSVAGIRVHPLGYRDSYAAKVGFADGWPVALDQSGKTAALTHCYGFVGVGRDLYPDTGTGGELYAVIGNAPRPLDRNIALVGRVIEGIDAFSALPRGTGDLGFYTDHAQEVPIAAVRLASSLPPADRPSFQYLNTNSTTFARYEHARANRKDEFFERPAGGVDICNVPVPIRRTPAR
jgi:peptidylprolyl isomerase